MRDTIDREESIYINYMKAIQYHRVNKFLKAKDHCVKAVELAIDKIITNIEFSVEESENLGNIAVFAEKLGVCDLNIPALLEKSVYLTSKPKDIIQLGRIYATGTGVMKNSKRAIELFFKAKAYSEIYAVLKQYPDYMPYCIDCFGDIIKEKDNKIRDLENKIITMTEKHEKIVGVLMDDHNQLCTELKNMDESKFTMSKMRIVDDYFIKTKN